MKMKTWNVSNKSMVAIKASIITFTLVALAIFITSASADVGVLSHTSSAYLTPKWTLPSENDELFTVTITNNGPDSVKEVRIYKHPDYTDIDCKSDPDGWNLIDEPTFCQYYTSDSSKFIKAGNSKDFQFSADTPSVIYPCEAYTWEFVTYDDGEPSMDRYISDTTNVDGTPPETTKTYGTPFYSDGTYDWITSDTSITLTPDDHGCVDKSTTWYRICLDPECYENYERLGYCDCDCDGKFTEYTGPFKIPDSSEHCIEFYSVDELGNKEDTKSQCVYVDNEAPNPDKEVGEPKLPGDGFDWWITQNTPITLDCDDQDPHPVDHEKVLWRFRLDGGTWQGWYEADPPKTIYFEEDSVHTLEFYCKDALKNAGPSDTEVFKVDTNPPTIKKTVGEPKIPCDPEDPSGCEYYVRDHVTEITVDATDEGLCAVNEVECSWWYTVDGGDGGDGGGKPPLTIIFEEDTVHELHVVCWDALNNEAEDVEVFKVDSTPPKTTKDYGEPYYEDEGGEWITSNTPITLTADEEGICAVGVDETFYRNNLVPDELCDRSNLGLCQPNGQDGEWIPYEGPIYKKEESCHMIEYYSVDLLGNEENVAFQCIYVDNTPPTITKTVGEPKIPCDPEDTSGCDYWVRDHVTPIDLYCTDEGNHPVNHVKLWYRILLDGEVLQGWTDPEDGHKQIIFEEDSVHTLQYYCEDVLGNTEGTRENPHEQVYRVDSTPPETTKTYDGPVYRDDTSEWIDSETYIVLNAIDYEEPCAVGVKETWYLNKLVDNKYCENPEEYCKPEDGGGWTLYEGPFQKEGESCHMLEYYSIDELGNQEQIKAQCFFVDKTPPETTKTYVGPLHGEDGKEWINFDTFIQLTSKDSEPHPSGVKEINYRNTLVDEVYCHNQTICQEALGSGDWTLYEGPFQKEEESCHLIEYYSVDNVDKEEEVKKQCVYVDNTGPELKKVVGAPKTVWDGKDAYFYDIGDLCWNGQEDEIECWKVTLCTPIHLDCVDPEPHPVDHESLCFKVDVDGEDATEQYCHVRDLLCDLKADNCDLISIGTMVDGYCCTAPPYTLYFEEETEHNLQAFCMDILDNISPVDEEKFKVEGTAFEIQLNKKWNLISVPFVLLNDDPEEIFEGIADNLDSVWTFDPEHLVCDETDPDGWCVYTADGDYDTLKHIVPGWGYWAMMNNSDLLVIGGSLMQPKVTPPMREMIPGWNLIGYYGTDGLDGYYGPHLDDTAYGSYAYCALYSLVDTASGLTEWSSLVTYWQPDSYPWKYLDECNTMNPGAGYWIEMDVEEGYAPATACPDHCI